MMTRSFMFFCNWVDTVYEEYMFRALHDLAAELFHNKAMQVTPPNPRA
jgi:hypothetical protein